MKKLLSVVAAAALLTLAAGCAGAGGGGAPLGAQTPVTELLERDMREIYETRDTQLPVAVVYTFQGNGERTETPLYGEEAVNRVLDAIAEITVTGETDVAVADSDASYAFLRADGSEAGRLAFNGEFLVCGQKRYTVAGDDALRKIDFPARSSRDTLTLDGPDPALSAFLKRCETESPARIQVLRDGKEQAITDADGIREAVNALYTIALPAAWKAEELPAVTLSAVFILPDGAPYTFTLYEGEAYAYEFPAPLGTWLYQLEDTQFFLDALQSAQ